MPFYLYRCDICQNEKEIFHPMKEVDEPSDSLLTSITCCNQTRHRVPQMTGSSSFQRKDSISKKEILLKRSSQHFKKEIEQIKKEKKISDY